MAVLGLRFCARAFSSCSKRGPLLIAVRGLSLSRPLLLRSTGSRRAGSVIVAHRPSCSVACGIFPDQSSNPCPLHWQADSQPLRHQGSPLKHILNRDDITPKGEKFDSFFKNLILFIFLYSRFLLVIYFIHISVYMSVPISQFIPPRHQLFFID